MDIIRHLAYFLKCDITLMLTLFIVLLGMWSRANAKFLRAAELDICKVEISSVNAVSLYRMAKSQFLNLNVFQLSVMIIVKFTVVESGNLIPIHK